MTKEKIINYAMSTPHNTNEAVLSAIIDQHDKETLGNAGFVKTVNGQGPDEQGNVDVAAAVSWDDLEGKPFGEDITKNYILESYTKEEFDSRDTYTEPSELKFVEGETYTVEIDGVEYNGLVAGDICESESGAWALFIGNPELLDIYPWHSADESCANNEVPFIFISHGDAPTVYFPRYMVFEDGYTWSTLSIYQESTAVHPLDPKFLPDEVVTEDKLEELDEYDGIIFCADRNYLEDSPSWQIIKGDFSTLLGMIKNSDNTKRKLPKVAFIWGMTSSVHMGQMLPMAVSVDENESSIKFVYLGYHTNMAYYTTFTVSWSSNNTLSKNYVLVSEEVN